LRLLALPQQQNALAVKSLGLRWHSFCIAHSAAGRRPPDTPTP
jgi:hypothetical protein